jgi:hypothetical protein
MSFASELPPAVRVEELPDGTRFVLPRRELGRFRYLGLLPLVAGLLMVAAPLLLLPVVVRGFAGVGFGVFMLASIAMAGVPLVVNGVTLIGLGLFVLAGHAEVEVRGGRLLAIDRYGWVRYRRPIPVERIRRIKVTDKGGDDDTAPTPQGSTPEELEGLALLLVETDGKPAWVAAGYRRDLLVPLAEQLSRLCRAETDAGETTAAPPVEVETAEPAGVTGLLLIDRPDRPSRSRAVWEYGADGGVTIQLPPPGIWRGSKGLLGFTLAWTAITGVGVAIATFVLVDMLKGSLAAWICPGVLLLFALAADVALLAWAVNLGRRRAVLAVVGPRLMVMQAGPFGSTRREWDRGELRTVAVGASGLTVNGVPAPELKVVRRGGDAAGVLCGRDEAELLWVATHLRAALRLGGADQRVT